jgi:hypothetical protein
MAPASASILAFPANRENNRECFELRPFWPLFGNACVNSLRNSNALRQIPCSIRNPEFSSPEQRIDPSEQGIYSDRLHRPSSVSRSGIGRLFE